MNPPPLRVVMFGLSITSSWGNGHATTYRGLVQELAARGHDVLFLEREVPWYAANRDLPCPPYGRTELYAGLAELAGRFTGAVRDADVVVVGSYVPDGAAVGEWVMATARGCKVFYDIDTPVTLARLARGDCEYLTRALIPRYDLYLSFTGGPTLHCLERIYHSPMARVLYCSTEPSLYRPERREPLWDLGYLGTYSVDRQPKLERLLLEPARRRRRSRFVVAGPLYPPAIRWPRNVERTEHLPPPDHRAFYNAQRFTLNITRSDMARAGYSPSVRLFEAAACASVIISDYWSGLETIFKPGEEILVARSSEDTLRYLSKLPEQERFAIGRRARRRVLAEHSAAHRATQLEGYLDEILSRRARTRAASPRRRPALALAESALPPGTAA